MTVRPGRVRAMDDHKGRPYGPRRAMDDHKGRPYGRLPSEAMDSRATARPSGVARG